MPAILQNYILECIILNGNLWISTNISLTLVRKFQYCSIDSYNRLPPGRRQAIVQTNDVQFTDTHKRHSVSKNLGYDVFLPDCTGL